jgi:hypothetical protein
MPKVYAISMFEGSDANSFVVGVEKDGPIRRFALDGAPMETVAEGPGGVMTITQVPGRGDQLLATSKFFSPNFGADDAKIVSYTRAEDGAWKESTLCDLPYVHRFGLLKGADGQLWVIACTIKSACRQIKNDWLTPGAVWAAPLVGNAEDYNDEHQLPLVKVSCQQLQNHGFYVSDDKTFALVTTAAGVFRYTPPAKPGDDWDVACLIVQPTSDVTACDLDGDGKDELVTISAFHGDTLAVWHEGDVEDTYVKVWEAEKKYNFLHAIWSGSLEGEKCAVVGNRRDDRDLMRLHHVDGSYELEVVDHDFGPANCWAFSDGGHDHIIAANRETDELALYDCEN